MRRLLFVVFLIILVALLPTRAEGASDSGIALMTVEVVGSVAVGVAWVSTGTASSGWTSMSAPANLMDSLTVAVNHNMSATQTFQVGVQVQKTAGPSWVGDFEITDGTQTLTWSQASFGTTQTFTTAVGGAAQSFTETIDTSLLIEALQAPSDEYSFLITVTLTSL